MVGAAVRAMRRRFAGHWGSMQVPGYSVVIGVGSEGDGAGEAASPAREKRPSAGESI